MGNVDLPIADFDSNHRFLMKPQNWLSIPKGRRGAFSMSDIKTMNHNILILNRFFDVFGIYPYSAKNQNYVNELILYGIMAA